MKINDFSIKNYRNIEDIYFEPFDGVNIIYGENAQGKTNILEAMFLFTGLKSFRSSKDSELLQFGKAQARLNIGFSTAQRDHKGEIKITDRRRASLNGVSLKSPTELMSRFPAALFSPGFMSLIQSGPSERRKFIDSAICQIKPKYAVILSEYTKLIKQRNAVLRDNEDIKSVKLFLDCINESFCNLGEEIFKERKAYLDLLLPYASDIYSGLSSGREEISFTYLRKGCHSEGETLSDILKSHEKADISAKMTLTGPHRDDIEININGVSARSFGSQGQKRSAAIALKLSEAEVIKNIIGEEPVILLDDVMSELDTARQDYILNHIKNRQVFITCCDPASILRMSEGKTFNIKDGRLI